MAEPKENPLMEKIVSLCKRRGFIYQSSEIYGGINGFWDYGPLGAELKRNVKELWWREMTRLRDDVVGLEATIIMHPQIWKASGHVDTFSDPMCDCLLTKKRFRADQVEPQSGTVYKYVGALPRESYEKLLAIKKTATEEEFESAVEGIFGEGAARNRKLREFWTEQMGIEGRGREIVLETVKSDYEFSFSVLLPQGKPPESARKVASQFYEKRGIKDPVLLGEETDRVENSTKFNPENGAQLTEPRPFNLMFKTFIGASEPAEEAYLRPETAQAIFAQFKNVLETSRQKVPFGIAQVGKAFRNEVTPRNFTFRSREFEQMELEFFIKPDEAVEAISGSVAKISDSQPSTLNPQPSWGWEAWHKYWDEERIRFYEGIGLPRTNERGVRLLEEYWKKPEELAHYARATVDILFKFPFGTQELEGIAARSDFDLSQHERFSGKPMGVFDEELRTAWGKLDSTRKAELSKRYYEARLKYLTKSGVEQAKAEKDAKEDADGLAKGQYIPHVIEPSAGADRLILALICNAFTEVTETDDKGKSETRVIMKFQIGRASCRERV